MRVSDILVLLVAVAALAALCVFTYCSCRPQLPNFSGWQVVEEYTPDLNEDGQPDLYVFIGFDAAPKQSSNQVMSYSLFDGVEKKLPELVIWINFTRDKNRPQKDGADLIVKNVARFYIKKGDKFRFIQKKVWSRPKEVIEEVVVKFIEPNSNFEKLLLTMLIQAGLSQDEAVKKIVTWVFYPENPAE